MSAGMGVANPKFSKSDRKPKKTKHCTIPKPLTRRRTKRILEKGTRLINMKVTIKEATRFNMMHKS